MKYVNKDNPDRPITPQTLLSNGEYDQDDMGLIYYDDLYNFGEEKRKEGEKNGLSRAVETVKKLRAQGHDWAAKEPKENHLIIREEAIKAIESLKNIEK